MLAPSPVLAGVLFVSPLSPGVSAGSLASATLSVLDNCFVYYEVRREEEKSVTLSEEDYKFWFVEEEEEEEA